MPDLPSRTKPRRIAVANRAERRHPRPATPNIPDELMTSESAARMLKVHHRTIRRWISEGTLPGFLVGERNIRVRKSDILAMVRQIPTAVNL